MSWAAALVNAAFPIAAAIGLAIPLRAAGNRRNYFFVGLLVLMGLADLALHLSLLGVLALPALLRHPHRRSMPCSVHHGRHGRPGDSDVHQQRRSRSGRRAPLGRRACRARLGARARRRRRGQLRAHRSRSSPLSPPARTPCVGRCGSRGETLRVPLVWMLHAGMRGSCPPGAARRGRLGADRRLAGDPRPHRRRHRRAHHRHDDAHLARPHRAAGCGPTASTSRAISCSCSPPSSGSASR